MISNQITASAPPGIMCACYHLVDSIELTILRANLRAHIDGHVTKVTNHGGHLAHVVLHLVLASIFGDPECKRGFSGGLDDVLGNIQWISR